MNFRPCGECNACCVGQLSGEVYGRKFGCGKKCDFLLNGLCSIYADRPSMCRTYQCAWSQHLFAEDLRPDKCGLMVSVENDEKGQKYFKIMELGHNIPQESYDRITSRISELNTYYKLVPYQSND